MQRRRTFSVGNAVVLASITGAALASAAFGDVVYQNTFETVAAFPEWSASNVSVAPSSDQRRFLGEFGNETVKLQLNDLPAHQQVTIAFDFYAIRSWDGETTPGPDIFGLQVAGGPSLLRSSFAVSSEAGAWRTQSYPLPAGTGAYYQRSSAAENNTLGYWYKDVTPCDAVWKMSFTFDHTASSVGFDFYALGLQAIGDESWGIDNVVVSVVPAPGAAVLALVALTGAGCRRRR